MSVIDVAATRAGIPYALPPDPNGVTSIDCSLYVLKTYQDSGLPFPGGVRTAEQIRQKCTPVAYGDVLAGDCLFFENTYQPDEAAGPDGHVASHIGISLGAGTFQMWDANDGRGNVGITNIGSQYWQQHMFQAARPNQVRAPVTPPVPGVPVKGATLDFLHRIRWEGMGIGYNPLTGIAAFWREHPELGAAVSMEATLEDGRNAQAFAGGIVVQGPNGPRLL